MTTANRILLAIDVYLLLFICAGLMMLHAMPRLPALGLLIAMCIAAVPFACVQDFARRD